MRRFIHFFLAFFLCTALACATATAFPAGNTSRMKEPLTDQGIALLFYKITGQIPDFDSWTTNLPEYIEANDIDRVIIREQGVKDFEELYRQTDIRANITVIIPVEISAYNEQVKGYFLPDLNEELFFTYRYLGEAYALVPQSIKDHQFVAMTPDEARNVETTLNANRMVTLELTLAPSYGDAKKPFQVNDENFWLTLGSVADLRLWAQNETQDLLWQSSLMSYAAPSDLLNLYKGR